MAKRSVRLSVIAVVALIVTVGCAPSPTSGGSPAAPTTSVWMAGDSLSQNVSTYMSPQPFMAGIGGAGFVNHYYVNEGTILDNTQHYISLYGVPSRILIVGGVSDHNVAPATAVAAMQATKSALEATGARVTWITEPKWSDYKTELAALNAWILTQPDHIDCAPSVESSYYDSGDHIHPTAGGYAVFANCIDAAL